MEPLVPFDGFEWDSGNWPKCGKHGLTRDSVEFAVFTAIATFKDPKATEDRIRVIGRSVEGRHVFVVLTMRVVAGLSLVRPISARYMHKQEVRRYVETGWPILSSDEEAEKFVAEADLSEYDFSDWTPVTFVLDDGRKMSAMPVRRSRLEWIEAEAKRRDVPVAVIVEELLARAMDEAAANRP